MRYNGDADSLGQLWNEDYRNDKLNIWQRWNTGSHYQIYFLLLFVLCPFSNWRIMDLHSFLSSVALSNVCLFSTSSRSFSAIHLHKPVKYILFQLLQYILWVLNSPRLLFSVCVPEISSFFLISSTSLLFVPILFDISLLLTCSVYRILSIYL